MTRLQPEKEVESMGDTFLDVLDTGKVAGEIWSYLEENQGFATTFQLKMALSISNASLYLAIGWLQREDKILIDRLDKGYKIIKK